MTWFGNLPAGLRGAIWMILGAFFFVAMIMLVRELSDRFNAYELVFWRALFGLVFLAPWLMRVGVRGLRTRRLGVHLIRNTIHFGGAALWFYAIAGINLSIAISLQFTVPLFAIVLAMIFLRERADTHRTVAALVGFSGVLIVLRPGVIDVEPIALITLLSAVLYGISNTLIKVLGRTDTSDLVVFYMNLIHMPLAVIGAAIFGYSIPAWGDLPWLFALAVSATMAHFCLAQALRSGDVGAVMPLDFLKLPMVAVAAWFLFGEPTTLWTWIGGGVIFASTYYVVKNETRRETGGA